MAFRRDRNLSHLYCLDTCSVISRLIRGVSFPPNLHGTFERVCCLSCDGLQSPSRGLCDSPPRTTLHPSATAAWRQMADCRSSVEGAGSQIRNLSVLVWPWRPCHADSSLPPRVLGRPMTASRSWPRNIPMCIPLRHFICPLSPVNSHSSVVWTASRQPRLDAVILASLIQTKAETASDPDCLAPARSARLTRGPPYGDPTSPRRRPRDTRSS